MYDTGAAAMEDGGSVAPGERVGAGFVGAADGPRNGAIPPDGAGVDGVLPGVAELVAGELVAGVLVAGGLVAGELVAGELVAGGGLVGGDVATDETTKPDPVTATFVSAHPCEGASVMAGVAVRTRNRAGGVLGGGVLGGGVVTVPLMPVSSVNVAAAQIAGVTLVQACTVIGSVHSWPPLYGEHVPFVRTGSATKEPLRFPRLSTVHPRLVAGELPWVAGEPP